MGGNVAEWVSDWFKYSLDKKEVVKDPQGPPAEESHARHLMGFKRIDRIKTVKGGCYCCSREAAGVGRDPPCGLRGGGELAS